ncbi:premelanosome protein a [Paramisgurnus dabryanus]|uniref:premelanosome protein a n=1 Tax=Paramisgurnus dabryanus TaxID=90735 RepID=UPI0031F38A3E
MTRMNLLALFLTLLPGVLSHYRSRFSRYRSWNSQMYPVWRDGDPRYRDCWTGGEVTFEMRSDSPTLTGAKTTFNIDVRFPQNQTALPDGQVVWARNCTINGTAYTMGQAVYPETNLTQEWTGVFPDGTPFTKTSNKKPRFIYVWKTWGKYWQVADGPSSLLTIETDKQPLGSYKMEVVIYHCRGKDKFIPLGYASAQFSITDQIPFAVTLSQVGDVTQGDQSFIQNTAVSFSVNLHDPSRYLSGSDVTFNWDFGDNSGTLISRETTVTHTYISAGSFRPQVILMAAILNDCTPNPSTAAAVVTPAPATGVPPSTSVSPVEDAGVESTDVPVLITDGSADDTNELAVAPVTDADEAQAVIITPEPVSDVSGSVSAGEDEDAEVIVNVSATLLPESPTDVVQTVAPVNVLSTEPAPADAAADVVVSVVPALDDTEITEVNETTEVTADSVSEATVSEIAADLETVTEATQATLIIAKRQAPEMPAESCFIYRYGSFSKTVDIVQGIESVEIVEVNNVIVTELEQNAVDLTITCQGSLPNEVCTVISDADCISPVQTLCNSVTPSPDCLMVLRQFFNDSGTFCINVSLTNDVSLAVTSARINVNMDTNSSSSSAGAALGVLLFICAMGTIAFFTHKRFKGYHPLIEDYTDNSLGSERISMPLNLWNFLSRSSSGESRPLLQGRVV